MVAFALGGQKGKREVIKHILIYLVNSLSYFTKLFSNLPLIRESSAWIDGLRHLFFAFQEKVSL